ncbi:MAG: S-layer homology domain-containing protein [Eubacteriales bacterium]|nr:S-layer homology domain-containing protein [Eubacteriales bacterium]
MRTLRKSLSLVLALVMCLSLCSGAFATQNFEPYEDGAEVGDVYVEATDFMIGSGIVEGYSADEIGATETLTREQVAKIIAVMKLGVNAAEKLAAVEDPFTDVAATRWSAGYIAYCVENGIIDGMGDGSFAPTAPVTGYQAGKMLLAAVGYGAADEFVGGSWAIQVARIGIPEGVYDDNLDAATHDPIERQQFFLMAFNTYNFVPQVKFSALINDYVYVGSNLSGATGTTVDPTYLNNKYFAAESFVTYSKGEDSYMVDDVPVYGIEYDEAGRYGHVWYKIVKGEYVAITDVYFDDNLLGEAYKGTKYADLINPDKTAFIAEPDDDLGNNGVIFFVNGKAAAAADAKELIDVKGNLVQFYDWDDDKYVDFIHVWAKTLDVVTTGGVKYNTDGDKATIAGIITTGKDIDEMAGFEDLKKDDVVLYFEDAAGITRFELAPTFLGQLTRTSYNADNELELTISGTKYTASEIDGSVGAAAIIEQGYNKDVNYYTDDFGFIAYADAVSETLSDFVVLLDLDVDDTALFDDSTVYALILKLDGTTEEVKISKIDDVDVEDVVLEDVVNLFYSYKVVSGKYQLTNVDAASGWDQTAHDAGAVKNNQSATVVDDTTTYANTSTVYLYPKYKTGITDSTDYNDVDSWKVATGISNAPTTEEGTALTVAYKSTGSVAKYVFIFGAIDSSAKAETMFFVNSAYWGFNGEVVVDGVVETEATREYQAIENGILDWHKTIDSDLFGEADAGLYEPTYDEDGNIAELGEALSDEYTGIAGGATDEEVVIVNPDADTEAYTYTSATRVFVITLKSSGDTKGFATMTEIAPAEIEEDDNDIVYLKLDTNENWIVEEIYIIKVDNELPEETETPAPSVVPTETPEE